MLFFRWTFLLLAFFLVEPQRLSAEVKCDQRIASIAVSTSVKNKSANFWIRKRAKLREIAERLSAREVIFQSVSKGYSLLVFREKAYLVWPHPDKAKRDFHNAIQFLELDLDQNLESQFSKIARANGRQYRTIKSIFYDFFWLWKKGRIANFSEDPNLNFQKLKQALAVATLEKIGETLVLEDLKDLIFRPASFRSTRKLSLNAPALYLLLAAVGADMSLSQSHWGKASPFFYNIRFGPAARWIISPLEKKWENENTRNRRVNRVLAFVNFAEGIERNRLGGFHANPTSDPHLFSLGSPLDSRPRRPNEYRTWEWTPYPSRFMIFQESRRAELAQSMTDPRRIDAWVDAIVKAKTEWRGDVFEFNGHWWKQKFLPNWVLAPLLPSESQWQSDDRMLVPEAMIGEILVDWQIAGPSEFAKYYIKLAAAGALDTQSNSFILNSHGDQKFLRESRIDLMSATFEVSQIFERLSKENARDLRSELETLVLKGDRVTSVAAADVLGRYKMKESIGVLLKRIQVASPEEHKYYLWNIETFETFYSSAEEAREILRKAIPDIDERMADAKALQEWVADHFIGFYAETLSAAMAREIADEHSGLNSRQKKYLENIKYEFDLGPQKSIW